MIHSCISEDSKNRFLRLQDLLQSLSIPFHVNKSLVRGLDYYCHTAFEITSTQLGAQATVCGGGRYDGLVEDLGGPSTPGVGFAIGTDRTLLACDAEKTFQMPEAAIEVFVVDVTGGMEALKLTTELRNAGFKTDRAWDNRSMKAQMKLADRSGALFAIIVGEEEVASDTVILKDLRESTGQSKITRETIQEDLRKRLR